MARHNHFQARKATEQHGFQEDPGENCREEAQGGATGSQGRGGRTEEITPLQMVTQSRGLGGTSLCPTRFFIFNYFIEKLALTVTIISFSILEVS